MTTTSHSCPSEALFGSSVLPQAIPVCDHYAGKERFIKKIFEIQANSSLVFDVTLDLEDGAEVQESTQQQRMITQLLLEADCLPERRGVRLHPVSDPLFASEVESFLPDIAPQISYVTIPKIRDFFDAQCAVKRINQSCKNTKALSFHFLIEAPTVFPHLHSIASLPRVRGLDFGLMDFVSSFHGAIPFSAMSSPGQFENIHVTQAKQRIVEAAQAFGVSASHNVTTDYQNPQQVHEDALQARTSFGFSRMWSIHPSQIEPIVRAFSPTTGELETAIELLLKAKSAAWGPIEFRSQLHDRASYRYFWTVVFREWKLGNKFPLEIERELFGNLVQARVH